MSQFSIQRKKKLIDSTIQIISSFDEIVIFTLIPMCLSSIINKFLFDIKRNEPIILEKLRDLFLTLAIPISS
jgi:hypothetical protein